MSPKIAIIVLTALVLAGCGTTEKKTVVVVPNGSTTVVSPNGNTHVVPPPQD